MKNLRHSLSFLFAVAMFVACVLACRPGFSPDGRRVVFAIFNEAARTTFLRVYDRPTGKTTTLRTLPWPSDSKNPVYCTASWSPSGAQIGVVVITKTNESVEILDAQSGQQIRSVQLTNAAEGIAVAPPVFTKDFLLFGGKMITRLDLRSGMVRYEKPASSSNETEIYFFNGDKSVGYYSVTAGTNDVHSVEFGMMDVEHLTYQRQQTIKTEADGPPEITRDGKRIAIFKHASSAIEIWSGAKLEKTIPVPLAEKSMGNLVWSKDQRRIFAPLVQNVKEDEGTVVLVQAPTDGGTVEQFKLGTVKGKIDELAPMCQLAISPDGKALALGTPMGSFDLTGRPTAMYVVDVSGMKPVIKPIGLADAVQK